MPLAPVQRLQQRQSAALLKLRQFLLPRACRGQHPARPGQGAGVFQARSGMSCYSQHVLDLI